MKDAFTKAAEWCKENWKSIAKLAVAVVVIAVLGVLSVVTGGVLATILAGAFLGALFGALISGVTGGLSNARNGGSFFEGFADGVLSGAVSGALTGAAFAGVGIAGSALGQFLGGACRFAENAGKILKVFECTSKITGVISFGMGAFDTAAMVVGFFNPDSPLVKLNEKLHASSLYNGFQIAVTITAVFTGAAYASMRERMKFPPTCFIAGTLILTAGGLVAIENIKAGDKVIATNPDTFETEEKSVIETYVNKTSQLIHLSIHDEIITTTWNHPFYVKDRGFVNAEELQIGDQVVSADGETYLVENHQVEIVETPETVYNFQIEDFHTYHVGNAGVLVHNVNCQKEEMIGANGTQVTSKTSWKNGKTERIIIKNQGS